MSARDLGQQTSAAVVAQPDREEGIVRAGGHPLQEEHERPEDWGWHGETGRKGRIGVFFAALVLFSMQFTNHEGNVENIWLNVIAAGLLVILVWDWRRRKNAWRAK